MDPILEQVRENVLKGIKRHNNTEEISVLQRNEEKEGLRKRKARSDLPKVL